MPAMGSLFSGIGGLDLGLEWAGFETRWQVEWDPFCQRVLERHWPGLPRWGDITTVDWSTVEPVDLIAGGFPCQPISIAGNQRAQSDERWLWPEFARAVRDLRPRLVLVENVRNLLAVNGGRAFGEVVGDLAALGYDAEWSILSASDVGAPHRRERVWIVGRRADAAPDPVGLELRDEPGRIGRARGQGAAESRDDGPEGSLADADGSGLGSDVRVLSPGQSDAAGLGALADTPRLRGRRSRQRAVDGGPAGPRGDERESTPGRSTIVSDGQRERLEGLEQGGSASGEDHRPSDGGDPGWWATEPDVGRVAHGVPARVDRLRALGNAVVPQVAFVKGRELMAMLEVPA